jgi:glutamate/tyrosine decarboxylase-like PLP-dependent enzyme
MTTGSSNANMIAMMAARNSHQKNIKQQGVFGCGPLFAFVNEESHYSLDKAANILGIGTDHLIKVPTDRFGAMDIRALGELLEEYSQK